MISGVVLMLILPIAMAVEHGLTVDQIARAFAVYPSISGSITDAARAMHVVVQSTAPELDPGD